MLDFGLTGELLRQFGLAGVAIAVVLLVVLLILRGKLWPDAMVQARLSDKESIIQTQAQALSKQGETLEKVSDSVEDLLEYARTNDHLLKSIKAEGDKNNA